MARSSSSAHFENVHYIQQSLRQVELRWLVKQEDDVGGPFTVQLSIVDHSFDHEEKEWMFQKEARENEQDTYDIPSHLLEPGHEYTISVKLMSSDQKARGDDTAASGLMQVVSTRMLDFRCGYTTNEMKMLLDKAIEFVTRKNAQLLRCEFFYRDKDREYYDCARYNCNGFLPSVLKNVNGDPASPINGHIQGVFVGVCVDWKTGSPPEESPFGYLRFSTPIECLYGPDFNLYFADFYCHVGAMSHHLSLVITRPDSAADLICKFRLPRLDRINNPFLRQNPKTGWMMHTTAVWIDVFYTEQVHIDSGRFNTVHCISAGPKTGKLKDARCKACNIDST